MRKEMKKQKTNVRSKRGITLIALVVTIVVLLILAGITISTLFGDNGIISAARKAAEDTERDQISTEQAIGNLKNEMNEQLPGGSSGIKASQVSAEPTKYYGKIVNYIASNQSVIGNDIKWKIFYADSDHIYLIASDYIPRETLPASTNASGNVTTNRPDTSNTYYPKGASFDPILNDYSGSARVSENLKYLNKSYFDYLTANSTTSTNNNMKAVAYMLDTKAWQGFKDSSGKADFVIGGPTVEMLFNSYCQKYNKVNLSGANQYQARVTSTTGYQISSDYGARWDTYLASLSTTDSLYVITTINPNSEHNWNFAESMCIASPSANGDINIIKVNYYGGVDDGYVSEYEYNSNRFFGFRPLVALKSNVGLEEQEDDTFNIK